THPSQRGAIKQPNQPRGQNSKKPRITRNTRMGEPFFPCNPCNLWFSISSPRKRLGHWSFKQNSILVSQKKSQRLNCLWSLNNLVIVVARERAMPKVEMPAAAVEVNLKRAVGAAEIWCVGQNDAVIRDAGEQNRRGGRSCQRANKLVQWLKRRHVSREVSPIP